MKNVLFLVVFILLFSFFDNALADTFAWEYSDCTKKCMPKEKCCNEVCGYKACIKHNMGRTTRGSAEVIDQGAWGSAMAVCFPHIDAIKKCTEANKEDAELARLRAEFCGLAVQKSPGSYSSKDSCIKEMSAGEKKGGKDPEYIKKAYRAGIAAYLSR